MTAFLLLLLIVVLGIGSTMLIDEEYRALEQQDVLRELERGRSALDLGTETLQGSVRDWAFWDETYRFARGEYSGYVETNLNSDTFDNLDIDSFLVFSPDGSLLFARTLNRSSSGFEGPSPPLLAALESAGLPARAFLSDDTVSGLVTVGDRPVLVAASRILTSTYGGPPAGTLCLVRLNDDERMDAIARLVGYPVTFVPPPLPAPPGTVVHEDGDVLVVPGNGSTVSGYTRIPDLGGRDVWLRVELPRTMVAAGDRAKTVFFGGIVFMVSLFGLIVLLAVERFYLGRIRTLTTSVGTIERNPGTGRIPALRGNDELTSLGAAINGMLDELQAFHNRLAESEERFRAVVEDQTELICRTGPDGAVVFANHAFLRFFDIPDDTGGRRLDGLLPAPIARELEDAARSHAPGTPPVETETVVGDGPSPRRIDWTVRALGGGAYQFVGRDETERYEALAELRRYRDELEELVAERTEELLAMHERLAATERLEALGVLAGGIAHDFNNLNAAALGNLELVRAGIAPDDPVQERLDQLARQLERSTSLTTQLLTFSQGGSPVKRAVRIAGLVAESAQFACRGTGVRCLVSSPEDLWTVEADPHQLSQVVSNLVMNAVQAMDGHGQVEVRLSNVVLNEDGTIPLPAGPYVRCEVRDHGPGVPPELLHRIFEPFFTTRPQGTGLGLSASFSIVRRHGGHLACEPAPGGGASFVFLLPALPGRHPAPRAVEPPHPERPVTGARVLLMDDEPAIREVTAAMLRMNGFQVVCAADGEEALDRYRAALTAGERFDLVIMDLTVPGGMGGVEAIEALLALDPRVRAIVSSGYANDPVMADPAAWGFVGVLPKPYRLNQLLDAVGSALLP